MKPVLTTTILCLLSMPLQANRWDCDKLTQPGSTDYLQSISYCGTNYGYSVSTEFDHLIKYQTETINLYFKANKPCKGKNCTD